MRTSIFNNKPYLDLVIQGKQMNVAKVLYIAKHKTITSDLHPEYAAKINVYGMPGHDESKLDVGRVLIANQKLNLPSVAGEYCETVIQSKSFAKRYSAIIIEIDDTYDTLVDIGTETVIMTEPGNVEDNSDNDASGLT